MQNLKLQSFQKICYCCSFARLCLTLCDPMDCSMPGSSVLHFLPEFAQTLVHWVGDAIWPSHPLPTSSPLPLIFRSIRVSSNESALRIKWPKYWNFSFSFNFSITPSNEYSGLISFRNDWFGLLAVQDTQESSPTPQFKASILWRSALFMVQLSYICTWLLEKS